MPTPGRQATWRCRRRRASRSDCAGGPTQRPWSGLRTNGGRGAGWQRTCCGLTITSSSDARAHRCKTTTRTTTRTGARVPDLDGPRLEPKGGQAKRLVIFLHGYGADGNDLIEIGKAWQAWLPDTAFVSPHAPEPCGQAPMGRQWFSLTFRNPDERWIGVNKAAPVLNRFIDAELERHKLTPSALALVGFSQGTMMALHVGLRRAAAPAAIVGYSGLFVLPENAEPEKFAGEITAKPPVLLIHGDQDDL